MYMYYMYIVLCHPLSIYCDVQCTRYYRKFSSSPTLLGSTTTSALTISGKEDIVTHMNMYMMCIPNSSHMSIPTPVCVCVCSGQQCERELHEAVHKLESTVLLLEEQLSRSQHDMHTLKEQHNTQTLRER